MEKPTQQTVVVLSKRGFPQSAFILDIAKISASTIADIRHQANQVDLSVSFHKTPTVDIRELLNQIKEM